MKRLQGALLGFVFVFSVAGSASANSFHFHDNYINCPGHIMHMTTDTNGTPKVGDKKVTYDYSTAEIQVGNKFTTGYSQWCKNDVTSGVTSVPRASNHAAIRMRTYRDCSRWSKKNIKPVDLDLPWYQH